MASLDVPESGTRVTLLHADVARENAIEGCIRETFGAAFALVRASLAADGEVRAALRSIARDECRHAALSWRIADWAMPRLGDDQRERIRRAMRAAVQQLVDAEAIACDDGHAACGLPTQEQQRRLVALLDASVFRLAA